MKWVVGVGMFSLATDDSQIGYFSLVSSRITWFLGVEEILIYVSKYINNVEPIWKVRVNSHIKPLKHITGSTIIFRRPFCKLLLPNFGMKYKPQEIKLLLLFRGSNNSSVKAYMKYTRSFSLFCFSLSLEHSLLSFLRAFCSLFPSVFFFSGIKCDFSQH